jgi:hypothetical protein
MYKGMTVLKLYTGHKKYLVQLHINSPQLFKETKQQLKFPLC